MKNTLLTTTKALITRDFEMEPLSESLTEEELLDLLSDQVAYWIEYKLEFLLSLMYRLDIDESKVNFALSPLAQTPANVALARLIFDRQKKRAETKMSYKPPKIEGWDEF